MSPWLFSCRVYLVLYAGSRFVEVSLAYGRMLAEPDPQSAAEVYGLALDTLHDPPAEAEVDIAIDLIRALRPVASDEDGVIGQTDDFAGAEYQFARVLDDLASLLVDDVKDVGDWLAAGLG